MDELLRLIGRIFYWIFIVFLIDTLFNAGRSRRTRRNTNSSYRNSYEGEEFGQTNQGTGYQGGYQNNDHYDSAMNSNSKSLLDEAYSVFGLTSKASDEEVKKKYRELAKKYHPDKNMGDIEAQAEMTKINNAYERIMESKH